MPVSRPTFMTVTTTVAALVLAVFALALITSRADAKIYYGYDYTGAATAGDGLGKQKLLKAGLSPSADLGDIAVVGKYLYWAEYDESRIGRLNLETKTMKSDWLTDAGGPWGMEANGDYLYWGAYDDGYIGRVGIKGKAKGKVRRNLVTGLPDIYDVTVTKKHLYWADYDADRIGRSLKNGKKQRPNFVKNVLNPCSLKDAGGWIYWAECGQPRIGRVRQDGSKVRKNWKTDALANSLAAKGKYLYFVVDDSLGRINMKSKTTKTKWTPNFVGSWGIDVK